MRPVCHIRCIVSAFTYKLNMSIANALGIFTPAITIAIFAGIAVTQGGALDTETAFTAMAILSMVTHPANMVMTIVPRAVSAFAGFERIQDFLLRQSPQAYRGTLTGKGSSYKTVWDSTNGNLEKERLAIEIRHLSIGYGHLLLENFNLGVASGSLVIISGPTGSGKSTLLRAILGEVVPASGSISLSTMQIAYCAQRPWLPNKTIKQVIYDAIDISDANDKDDKRWYDEVTTMCCLTHDFDCLPDGDQTATGSGGLNLSGGQRQRVV